MSSLSFAQSIDKYVPENAKKYLPVLQIEVSKNFTDLQYPYYFGGLIEQESCISLKHSRCWSATSSLKTAREEGAGLGQITKAYNKDGSIRFDSLNDLRARHMAELRELAWGNVYQRPDLQMRSIILMSKDNYKVFYLVNDQKERLKMTDAAYNAGPGSVKKRRLQCGLTKGCDPQQWFDNVGRMKVLSQKPIYGDRSPQGINDEHVDLIFNHRMDKYKPYFVSSK